jgi:hypothetical protein
MFIPDADAGSGFFPSRIQPKKDQGKNKSVVSPFLVEIYLIFIEQVQKKIQVN